jgi:hypothetical protein
MPEAVYYLAAAPKQSVQVPTLTRADGVRQLLERPPSERQAGWNLLTLERAELQSGPRLHIQNGERKIFDLFVDGTFTAIGTFDGFLGVGRWNFWQQPQVNGLAVVEFTHEFVAFYERLLHEYLEPLPREVQFVVGVRHAHFEEDGEERKLLLQPGPVGNSYGHPGWRYQLREAPEGSFEEKYDARTSPDSPHLDIPMVSYELVRRSSTGSASPTKTPYTNEAGNAIDTLRYEITASCPSAPRRRCATSSVGR